MTDPKPEAEAFKREIIGPRTAEEAWELLCRSRNGQNQGLHTLGLSFLLSDHLCLCSSLTAKWPLLLPLYPGHAHENRKAAWSCFQSHDPRGSRGFPQQLQEKIPGRKPKGLWAAFCPMATQPEDLTSYKNKPIPQSWQCPQEPSKNMASDSRQRADRCLAMLSHAACSKLPSRTNNPDLPQLLVAWQTLKPNNFRLKYQH